MATSAPRTEPYATRSNGAVAVPALMALVLVAALLALQSQSAIAQDAYGPPAPLEVKIEAQRVLAPPAAVPPQLGAIAWETVREYPAIDAAEASIRASQSDIEAAKWLRFPSLSVGARLGAERAGRLAPQVRLEQPLWAGGRITGTINRAEAVSAVRSAQLEETVQDLALQAINAYYAATTATMRETVLRGSLAEHQRLVDSMARRVAQEVSPRSDLELATSRLAQVQQQLSLTTAQRFTNLQRLAELTGNPDLELGPVPEYSPLLHHPSTEGAVTQALICDPSRRRLMAEAEVAEADRKLAQAAIYPRVGVQITQDEDFGTRFGLVVSAQSDGGLSGLAAARGAGFRQQASVLQISVAERQLREQIILDVVENTTSAGTIQSSSAAAIASGKVTESFVRQFITGRRTWLDVMNAVRESTSAQIALIDAQSTAMASTGRLLLRTCQWRPDLMGGSDGATQ